MTKPKYLIVKSKGPKFRRAKIDFTRKAKTLNVAELTDEQFDAIFHETRLQVKESEHDDSVGNTEKAKSHTKKETKKTKAAPKKATTKKEEAVKKVGAKKEAAKPRGPFQKNDPKAK